MTDSVGRPAPGPSGPSANAYGDLTSPQAGRAAADEDRLLLLPVGALEQHGKGLPLATDSIRAQYVARQVALGLNGRGLVLPSIDYGISPHHAAFPGTVTLPPQVFMDLVRSVAQGVIRDGWRKLLVITGHGGNSAALGVVQQELLGDHPDFVFAYSGLSVLATEAQGRMSRAEVSGHSGESETAQLMAIMPELVRPEELSAGATALDDLGPRARLSRTAQPKVAVGFESYAPNGVLGDPTTVTAADGEEILAEIVRKITDYSHRLLAV